MIAILVPLWIAVLPILLAVAWLTYEVTTLAMNWIDPRIKDYLIRRFEKRTGTKWDPEWDTFGKKKK